LSFPEGMGRRDEPAEPARPRGPGALVDRDASANARDTGADTDKGVDATIAPSAPVMQVHNAYIVAQTPEGMVIADQHALHERIIYNELRARLAEGRLAGQRLLIPQPVRVTAAEVAALDAHADLLRQLGMEVEPFGPDAVAIQQSPSLLADRGADAGEFLRDIIDRIMDSEGDQAERLLEDVLEVMACKAAVKAGQALAPAELEALLARAGETDKSSACPHGRPTMLKLTLRDLERQFRRT
jgi:DNA mismatch repair protein MutL